MVTQSTPNVTIRARWTQNHHPFQGWCLKQFGQSNTCSLRETQSRHWLGGRGGCWEPDRCHRTGVRVQAEYWGYLYHDRSMRISKEESRLYAKGVRDVFPSQENVYIERCTHTGVIHIYMNVCMYHIKLWHFIPTAATKEGLQPVDTVLCALAFPTWAVADPDRFL